MTASPFTVDVYDTSMTRLGQALSYVSASVLLKYNDVGHYVLLLRAGTEAANLLGADAGRRCVIGYRGATLISGAIDVRRQFDEGHGEFIEVTGVDDTIELERRVAYQDPDGPFPAEGTVFNQSVGYKKYTGNGETVLRNLVNDNAILRLPVPTLALETNQNRGATVTNLPVRMDTVLDRCQTAATIAGLGFKVVQVGAALKFQVYAPATQPVRLSRALGNLQKWEHVKTGPVATRVIAAGQGEEVLRDYVQKTVTTFEAQWGIRERHADARDVDTDADLDTRSNQYLDENGLPKVGIAAVPIDTPQMTFGVHYKLGDKVVVEFTGGAATDIVRQVELVHDSSGRFTATPGVGDLRQLDPRGPVMARLRDVTARVSKLEQRR